MPEDLVATRALLGEVLDHLETIEKRMAWRSRITAAGFLLVAVCILVIAGVVRNNRDEQIASCKAGREELRVMAEAIAVRVRGRASHDRAVEPAEPNPGSEGSRQRVR